MKKNVLFFITLKLLTLSSIIYADVDCQSGLLTQKIGENNLQTWQKWQSKRTIKKDLAGSGKAQTISVIKNGATDDWGIYINQEGKKTLLYATTTTKPLQVATDNTSSLKIINSETNQFYEVSYKSPDNFTICPKQRTNKPSNYICTGVAELHEIPPPEPGDGMTHYVDLDEDGIQETVTYKMLSIDGSARWIINVIDTSGASTTVYNGRSGKGVSFLNAYGLNGGKPVIHIVFMHGKKVKEAVEINYLGPGKFTNCPISNGQEMLSFFGIRY